MIRKDIFIFRFLHRVIPLRTLSHRLIKNIPNEEPRSRAARSLIVRSYYFHIRSLTPQQAARNALAIRFNLFLFLQILKDLNPSVKGISDIDSIFFVNIHPCGVLKLPCPSPCLSDPQEKPSFIVKNLEIVECSIQPHIYDLLNRTPIPAGLVKCRDYRLILRMF